MLLIAASRSPGKALDLDAAIALVTAVDALLSASLIAQARPIVRELRSALEGAQRPRALVIDLGTADVALLVDERVPAKRSGQRGARSKRASYTERAHPK